MPDLLDVLGEAQGRGLLGPGPVEEQIAHSRALARLVGEPPGSVLDLGSGGGVPGLVWALEWPDSRATLLDSRRRAAGFVEHAATALALTGRVAVATGRAEDLARRADLRGSFDLVVARAFGPPAVTAECAVGFLAVAGRLVVSEPPDPDAGRWPAVGLRQLGLEGPRVSRRGDAAVAVMTRSGPLDERWPRRTGTPAKRPLW